MKNKIEKAAGILRLAANDFKSKYAGSALGSLWAAAEPLVTVIVYWFVYTVALGQDDFGGVPYYLWLSVGLAPWFFISDGIRGVTSVFRDYSFLVKKMRFDTSTLPIVRTASAFMSHLIFMCLVFVLCMLNKTELSGVVLLPVSFCTVFVYAAGRIAALLCSRFKDTQNIVLILSNIGFWMTPVFWSGDTLPHKINFLLRLNPAAVIVDGYRAAVLYGNSMSFQDTVYIFILCAVLLVMGKMYEKSTLGSIADRL